MNTTLKLKTGCPSQVNSVPNWPKAPSCQGLDGCLFLYPQAAWESLISVIPVAAHQGDARSFTRSLSYGAVEVEIDSLGRILIPDYLKSFAGLKIPV